MAEIEPTIDKLNESTVMLNMRKLAGAVDNNNNILQQNIQQAIDTANNAMEATQGFDDRISQNEQDITTIKGNITTIEEDLTTIETKNTEQDTAIEQNATAIETEKNVRIENDITDVGLTYNPNTGSLEIQLLRAEGDLEDSVVARFIQTATLIPTTTERAFKIRFNFYDGTSYDTNEFLIPEGGGTDVSVTGVTVVDGTTPDSFQVQIQLSDGEPLKSNDYVIDIPASENTYPTAVTGTIQGTNINIDITLNNSTHVNGTVDISTLATAESVQDIQEQLTGLALTSSGNQMSINGTSANIVNSISGTVSDGKLKISVNGVESGDIPLPESDIIYCLGTNNELTYPSISLGGNISDYIVTPIDKGYYNTGNQSIVNISSIFKNLNFINWNIITTEMGVHSFNPDNTHESDYNYKITVEANKYVELGEYCKLIEISDKVYKIVDNFNSEKYNYMLITNLVSYRNDNIENTIQKVNAIVYNNKIKFDKNVSNVSSSNTVSSFDIVYTKDSVVTFYKDEPSFN